nr:MAG TPA: hypothetical protein [Siphovirus LN-2020-2]
MPETQETEERINYLLPYLHDLVPHENERERVEWIEQPFHIRFGEDD